METTLKLFYWDGVPNIVDAKKDKAGAERTNLFLNSTMVFTFIAENDEIVVPKKSAKTDGHQLIRYSVAYTIHGIFCSVVERFFMIVLRRLNKKARS